MSDGIFGPHQPLDYDRDALSPAQYAYAVTKAHIF